MYLEFSRRIKDYFCSNAFYFRSEQRRRIYKLLGLSVVCTLPMAASFANESSVAPYLALVSLVPAMYVVRRLVVCGEVILFAFISSLLANVMVMHWLPTAIKDVTSLGLFWAPLLSWALCFFWGFPLALFLIAYRYCHGRQVIFIASFAVALFNYWPSLFGSNLLFPLLNAAWLSGSTYFIGASVVELLVIVQSACLVSALATRTLRPVYGALLILLFLLALDAAANHYVSLAPARSLNVALVQTDNVYSKKLSSAEEIDLFMRQIIDESALRPDLVVFPENVFPFNMADDPEAADAAIESLKRLSLEQDLAFLVSAIQQVFGDGVSGEDQTKVTKITSLLIGRGQLLGVADKAKTIPFAEMTPAWAVPALQWLGGTIQLRTPSSEYQPGTVKGIPIVPLTCFESLDGEVVESRLGGRPGLLVNQSNMDSFGTPGAFSYRAALWGHMIHEQRWVNQWHVPVVRAVRSGGATGIDALGALDLDLLEQSWGQEWVTSRVSVPEALPLDRLVGSLRAWLLWAVKGLAICGFVQCLLGLVRSRR